MAALTLFTIGYEAKTQVEFLDELVLAGVAQVVDVRAVAASRRPGFSKTALSGALAEVRISYVHLRDLGTPKAGREAARLGKTALMREIYEAQLATPEAGLAFERMRAAIRDKPSALLCFERDAKTCHRTALAERLHLQEGFAIVDI